MSKDFGGGDAQARLRAWMADRQEKRDRFRAEVAVPEEKWRNTYVRNRAMRRAQAARARAAARQDARDDLRDSRRIARQAARGAA